MMSTKGSLTKIRGEMADPNKNRSPFGARSDWASFLSVSASHVAAATSCHFLDVPPIKGFPFSLPDSHQEEGKERSTEVAQRTLPSC